MCPLCVLFCVISGGGPEILLATNSENPALLSWANSPTFPSLHLRHSSFSNPSVALPTPQITLQPFRCFIYVTAHSPTLLSLFLRHRLLTYVTWRAALVHWRKINKRRKKEREIKRERKKEKEKIASGIFRHLVKLWLKFNVEVPLCCDFGYPYDN